MWVDQREAECNIQYCTGKCSFQLSFEPTFDAKIDKARTCAINIVGLNTFTCGIEYYLTFKSLYGFIVMLCIVVVVYVPV